MDFGTVFVEFRSNVDKFTRELRQVGFQLNVMESLAKNQEQIWRAVATTAFYFSRKMTDGMLGLAEAAGEVDQKMAGLRTVLKATDAEFENLKNTAREWSNEHVTSVNDLLEASYNMASAGLNISQVMATMKNASILAAGAYGTMEQATSLLTNAMNVFGNTMPSYISDMSKADEMTNVFAYTIQKFKIILPQLESGMARIAGVASAFGFDMSEAAMALGALTTAGLSAEQAGTAIKNFYERLAKAAKEMGLQVFDSSGKIRGLYDLLGDIKQYYGGAIDSTEEFAHAQGIFTTRGSQVITILQEMSEELRNHSIQAKESATATELAAEVEQGFSAQMTILSNNVNNLKVAFGEGLTGTIKLVADGLGALSSILQTMPGWLQAVISNFLLFSSVAITVVAGVAMIRKSFGALLTQIKTLIIGVPILGTVLKAAFSPVGLGITAAIAAIGFVIGLISKQKEETRKLNEETAKQAKEIVNLYTTYKASENAMKKNTEFAEEFLSVQKELEKYLPESSKTKISAIKIDGTEEEILKAISEELDKIGESARETSRLKLTLEIKDTWDKLKEVNEELNKMKAYRNTNLDELLIGYKKIIEEESKLKDMSALEATFSLDYIIEKSKILNNQFKNLGITIYDSKGKLKEYDIIAAEIAIAFNDLSQEAETLQSKINDLSQESLSLTDAQFKFRTEILGAFKEIENSVDPVNTKVEKLGWLIKRVEEHQAAGGGAQDVLNVLIEGYDKLTAKVRAYEEELAKVSVVALETFNKLSDIESVNIALGITGEATLEDQIKVLEKALSDLSAKALEALQNGEELDDVYVNTYTAIVNKLKEKQRELISFYEQSSKTIVDKFSGITLENAIDVSDIIDVESAKAQYNELKNIYDDLKEYVKSFNNLSISLSTDETLNFGAFGDSIEVSANKVDTIRSSLEEVIESIKTLKNAGLEVPPVFTQMYEELKKLFYIESLNDIFIRLAESIKAIKDEFASATTYAQNFISVLEGKGVSSFESQYEKSKDELLSYAEAIDEVIQLKQKYIESGGKEASVLQNFSTQIIELNNQMQHQTGIVKSYYEELELYRTSIKGILSEKIGGTTEFNIKTNVSKALNELTIEISKINEMSLVLGDTQEEAAEKIIAAYSATVEELTKYKVELELLGKDASIVSDIISSLTDDLNKQASAIRKTVNALDEVRKEIGIIREVGEITGKSLSEVESSVTSALESKINALVASKGEGTKTAEEIEEINKQIKELEESYKESTSAKEYYLEQERYVSQLAEDIIILNNNVYDLNNSLSKIQFEQENFGLSDIEALDKSIDAVKSKIVELNEIIIRNEEGSTIYEEASEQIEELKNVLKDLISMSGEVQLYDEINNIIKDFNKEIFVDNEISIALNKENTDSIKDVITSIEDSLSNLIERKYEIDNLNISETAKKELLKDLQSTISDFRSMLSTALNEELNLSINSLLEENVYDINELLNYGEILDKNIFDELLSLSRGKLEDLIKLERETTQSNKLFVENFISDLGKIDSSISETISSVDTNIIDKLEYGDSFDSLKNSLQSLYTYSEENGITFDTTEIENARVLLDEIKKSVEKPEEFAVIVETEGIEETATDIEKMAVDIKTVSEETENIITDEEREKIILFTEDVNNLVDSVENMSTIQVGIDTSRLKTEIENAIAEIKQRIKESLESDVVLTIKNLNFELKNKDFANKLLGKSELESLEDKLSSVMSAFNSAISTRFEALKQGIDTKNIDRGIQSITNGIRELKKEILDTKIETIDFENEFARIDFRAEFFDESKISGIEEKMGLVKEEVMELYDSLQLATDEISTMGDEVLSLSEVEEKLNKEIKLIEESISNTKKELESFVEEEKELIKQKEKEIGLYEEESKNLQEDLNYTIEQKEVLNNLIAGYEETIEKIKEKMEELREKYSDLLGELHTEIIKEINKTYEQNISIKGNLSIIFAEDDLTAIKDKIGSVKELITDLVKERYEILKNSMFTSDKKVEMFLKIQEEINNAHTELNKLMQEEIEIKIKFANDELIRGIEELRKYGTILGSDIYTSSIDIAISKLKELIALEASAMQTNETSAQNFKKAIDSFVQTGNEALSNIFNKGLGDAGEKLTSIIQNLYGVLLDEEKGLLHTVRSLDDIEFNNALIRGIQDAFVQLKDQVREMFSESEAEGIIEELDKIIYKISEISDSQMYIDTGPIKMGIQETIEQLNRLKSLIVESYSSELSAISQLTNMSLFSEQELRELRNMAYDEAIARLKEYAMWLARTNQLTMQAAIAIDAMYSEIDSHKTSDGFAEQSAFIFGSIQGLTAVSDAAIKTLNSFTSASNPSFIDSLLGIDATTDEKIEAAKNSINEINNLYLQAEKNYQQYAGKGGPGLAGEILGAFEYYAKIARDKAKIALEEALNEIKELYENKYKEIIDNLEKENERATKSFEAFGDVSAYVDQQLDNVVSAIEEMIELKEAIDLSPNLEWTQENEDAYQGLIKTYNELKAIGEVTKGLSDAFNDAISSFANELMSGTSLDTALDGFRKNLRDSVRNAVVQALVSAVIIQSGLAKKLEQIGKEVGAAIADGVISWEEEDLINDLLDGLISDADEITDVLEEALSNLGWISDDIDDVQDIIDEIEPVQLFDVSIIKSDLSSVFSEFSENIKTMSFETAWGKASKSFKEKLKSSIINALIESAIEAGALKSKMEKLGLMVGEAIKDGIITAAEQANIDLLTESLLSDAENVAEVIANLVDSFDKANKKNNLPALPPITNELSGNRNMDYIPVSDSGITEPIVDQVEIFVGEINNLKIYLSENTAAIQELTQSFSEDVVTAKKRNRKEHVGDTYLPDGTPIHLYGNPEFVGGNSGSEGSGVSSDDVLKSLNNYLSSNLNLANSLISRVSETNSILKGAGSASKTENQYYTITIDSGAIVVNSTVQDTEELAETVMDKMKDRMEWEIRTAGGRI